MDEQVLNSIFYRYDTYGVVYISAMEFKKFSTTRGKLRHFIDKLKTMGLKIIGKSTMGKFKKANKYTLTGKLLDLYTQYLEKKTSPTIIQDIITKLSSRNILQALGFTINKKKTIQNKNIRWNHTFISDFKSNLYCNKFDFVKNYLNFSPIEAIQWFKLNFNI